MHKSTEGFIWTPTGYHYGLPTTSTIPSTPTSSLSGTYDVIVLGAGFTGLTTARDLAFRGKKVLLIEARDRIGGRCWTAQTDELDSSAKLEIGGAWVHWLQPHVFSELQRYGLDQFVETVSHPDAEVVGKEGRDGSATLLDPHEGKEMMERIGQLMERFFDVDGQGGRSVLSFPFNTQASVAKSAEYLKLEELSITDRVAQLELGDEDRDMLSAHAASFFGLDPGQVSFMEVLKTHALCGFDQDMIEAATMKYKISEGTTGLALAILKDFNGDRILRAPVKAVTQDLGGSFPVTVTLQNGEVYRAKALVSTIPMNVLPSITFDPPLSELRREAFTAGVTPARTDKLLVCTPTKFERGFNFTCEGDESDLPYTAGFTDGSYGPNTLLTLLTRPDHALDRSNENIRLVETLHPTGIELHSAYGHLWSQDPYAGGVMPVRKPGFMRYYEEVRRPHGRVWFAGSDFADGWRGFISGAFEDAYRVTREVLGRGDIW
ncbi:amine oxidase [Aspergillus steynii IBT 23096]|uniref:Amine oxidase n=1 Tax=Aspergillus steynii IBT 23096 TaxID=1392250 RepID=A0A2I2FRS8_9EURO|nr:amine oxidase [Aspergillus steynii IBT 23096]PLB43333.1 amine oxidase [Aspergillus steynii IBT 23096]